MTPPSRSVRRFIASLALAALTALSAAARPAAAFEPIEKGPLHWKLSGYAKSFASMTDVGDLYRDLDIAPRSTLWDDSTRLRLNSELALGDVFEFVVHYEAVGQYGDTLRMRSLAEERYGALPFGGQVIEALFPTIVIPQYMDLDHVVYEDDEARLLHRLDRLFVRLHAGPADLTLGRSTLTWGPGRIWNPTDYLAAFSPTEIDKELKPGVDMAHARVRLLQGVFIEGFAAPVREGAREIDDQNSATAGRLSAGVASVDLGVSGGWLYDRATLGLDADANVLGAGVRGAVTASRVRDVEDKTFYRAVAGIDYGFAHRWNPYVCAEYFYNDLGEQHADHYAELTDRPEFTGAYQRGEGVNLGTHYAGLIASIQPHPLVSLSETAIVNAGDTGVQSLFVATWSALQNLDVQLGALNTFGPTPSEFGALPNPLTGKDIAAPDLYFTYVKFYF